MPRLHAACLALLLALPAAASAQDLSGFDASSLLGSAQDVLARAPDREVDGLFHALHGAMREPAEARAICTLFDDNGQRGLDGLNNVAMQLPEARRQGFVDAMAQLLVASLQGQRQPYDEAAAAQALRSNGARATILHDGFTAGLADGAAPQARCDSMRQLMDVLVDRPQPERASVVRLLLSQGLRQASF